MPTYFVEKIWRGIADKKLSDDGYGKWLYGANLPDVAVTSVKPKIHTIRLDKNNLWKPGRDIHFVINNRTPKRYQFAPVLKCISVQEIEIKNLFSDQMGVSIDGDFLQDCEVEDLAFNDGFDSANDFYDFFKGGDFKGKLIHWTDCEYLGLPF
ncbi:MAG: hypothetical protein AAFZ15_32405 [Bacteroidota bacterium]